MVVVAVWLFDVLFLFSGDDAVYALDLSLANYCMLLCMLWTYH